MARILFSNKIANLSNLGKLSKEKGPVAERTMPVLHITILKDFTESVYR